MKPKTDNVVLAPGPLHLFWTAGAYYMWELSRKYNVVLVVDEIYRASQPFKKAAGLADVADIVYVPAGNAFIRHRFYAREFKRVIKESRPKAIFHHDAVYVQMMYLYYWGRKFVPGMLRISCLAGLATSYWDPVADFDAELLAAKLHIPRAVARFLNETKGWLSMVLNYFILPAVFAGKVFVPVMNITNGKILKKYWNDQFDFFLLYSEADQKSMGKWCGSTDGFVQVRHPLETAGREFNGRFYDIEEKAIVIIMPTYGLINTYQKENNLSDKEIIDHVSDKWVEAITILRSKFPGYELVLKLHPSQERDMLWQKIVAEIKNACAGLTLVNPRENGQEWVLRSKVVVSDFSSVLWWAAFFDSKVAISLDIFGTRFSDEMKYRESVYYFNNLKDFAGAEFTRNRNKKPEGLPSLNNFLSGVMV
ncbi:MAG: hypothetical protein A2021_01545 [Elusimicrobia bacterium GWF2_52_66]|nr:MAG: hypothetical protein A2X33_02575 [Elusimicrobia bacterium GWA2_51_34]OGR86997.1 MAG: hypothetical protein A2021_01545 [Elusimicrobia bacterium GWF2_52_66]HAF96549.1 hypothetical protein [Elusimicrobiota bacterium]HCE98225.1 hypothetical protein [Elusimicrobiota bacterium]